jgi:protein gp37
MEAGVEPAPSRLRAGCSAAEPLHGSGKDNRSDVEHSAAAAHVGTRVPSGGSRRLCAEVWRGGIVAHEIMSDGSAIEWTDATWNPVRGCVKVSPGCKHCYAQTFAERWRGIPDHPYGQGFDLRLVPEKLEDPLRWRKSRRVFVNSMSDLFQDGVPVDFIARVFATMARAGWHTYQLLTKRAERMREVVNRLPSPLIDLPHVWLGVSVENRKHGLPRIDDLRHTRAAVRFLSVEPLLEDLGPFDLTGIHWVIVGGESGPGARPMQPEWVRSIRRQCREQRVPFFFKQWGGVQKGKHGRLLDGRTYDEFPRTAESQHAPQLAHRSRPRGLTVLPGDAKV